MTIHYVAKIMACLDGSKDGC